MPDGSAEVIVWIELEGEAGRTRFRHSLTSKAARRLREYAEEMGLELTEYIAMVVDLGWYAPIEKMDECLRKHGHPDIRFWGPKGYCTKCGTVLVDESPCRAQSKENCRIVGCKTHGKAWRKALGIGDGKPKKKR